MKLKHGMKDVSACISIRNCMKIFSGTCQAILCYQNNTLISGQVLNGCHISFVLRGCFVCVARRDPRWGARERGGLQDNSQQYLSSRCRSCDSLSERGFVRINLQTEDSHFVLSNSIFFEDMLDCCGFSNNSCEERAA